ncbi:hypothetical protein [Streptomyces sp. NBC_01190]|uniref:hypothetical protein n=1 Tax=Streptomyces sp. NBC_01190 TaxID=2903767 RepID=UPI00386557DE|nr:hypothetical protein OG519_09265 [Streptomyces sp. NBC_01190]
MTSRRLAVHTAILTVVLAVTWAPLMHWGAGKSWAYTALLGAVIVAGGVVTRLVVRALHR